MTVTTEQRALWRRLAREWEAAPDEPMSEDPMKVLDTLTAAVPALLEALEEAEREIVDRADAEQHLMRDIADLLAERDALALRVKGLEEALGDLLFTSDPHSTGSVIDHLETWAKARAAFVGLAPPASPGAPAPTTEERSDDR